MPLSAKVPGRRPCPFGSRLGIFRSEGEQGLPIGGQPQEVTGEPTANRGLLCSLRCPAQRLGVPPPPKIRSQRHDRVRRTQIALTCRHFIDAGDAALPRLKPLLAPWACCVNQDEKEGQREGEPGCPGLASPGGWSSSQPPRPAIVSNATEAVSCSSSAFSRAREYRPPCCPPGTAPSRPRPSRRPVRCEDS